ncbi:nicotinate phosphoribosyltransferase-like [Lingula anatina]|uniref:Nicotinate phosphoribosyltransferase n=1 Tax=Lingula anatina TaxID=7574 RepID=A0A1S3GZZ9_LINAN|nr:nicotinate phosphoribosyltransferase [Lingula anatina]XP_013390521.1 nicotinate phosphoribosyltransferase-like [Lingula anatina]|eukprot:XP_013378806.1 nicotinate phosphoribosyltransferase [Lingula anatina]
MEAPEKGVPLSTKLSKHGQNGVIQPLLTDLYQITMAYAYWKSQKYEDTAVFDLFFRRNPFRGEFTIFAGLEECIKFLEHFHYTTDDIEYLRTILPPTTEEEFFEFLHNLTAKDVIVYAVDEGSVVFPRVPIIRLEGPLPVVQLLETTLLNLVNYASLVATNAARFRLAAGQDKQLLEFGLRRAQGPDGGLSASRYCYIGGFDGTSNVLAGKLFDIPVKGTHAHAFVTSYEKLDDVHERTMTAKDGSKTVDFVSLCEQKLEELSKVLGFPIDQVHMGELAAFVSYARAFPTGFLALLDTYDVMKSGVHNFCAVCLALHDLGYRPVGVRLDSGDLAYLSLLLRERFKKVAEKFNLDWFGKLTIVASNDIDEDTIHSLNQQGHSIDAYGIGTHLVTCKKQPALGCVYKLVEINGLARIKLSQDVEKVTTPGKKVAYRLFGSDGNALLDLMTQSEEEPPKVKERVLCRHPFVESKRAYVIPAYVECLHKLYWKDGQVQQPLPKMKEIKERALASLNKLRPDHKRALNPTPYKVSVSDQLYNFMHDLWLDNAPIGELS